MYCDPTGHWLVFAIVATLVGGCIALAAVNHELGAEVSTGKEIPIHTPTSNLPFVSIEEGVGYNKDFGNDKTLTFFAEGTEVVNSSVGIDVVSNTGYGASVELGIGKSALGIHLGNQSIELGVQDFFKGYYKQSIKKENGYIYNKTMVDTNQLALHVLRWILPFIIPFNMPGFQPHTA